MSCYIASTDNRFYVKSENTYGSVPAISAENRFPAVKLSARQTNDRAQRLDKTGGRTFMGIPSGVRRQTGFQLKTYMAGWTDPTKPPSHSPLFEAAMGRAAVRFSGGTVSSTSGPRGITFGSSHGLSVGQAITFGGELRFVTGVVSSQTVQLNAPFTLQPTAGAPIGPTITFMLGSELGSVSLFDCWSPSTAVQRIVCGAAVDKMQLTVNSDFHEFEFGGPGADIVDNLSFQTGQGALTAFPNEPALAGFSYMPIPGHIGQAWLGSAPDRIYALTEASVKLENNIEQRAKEFGSMLPRCIVAGERSVSVDFTVYEQDDDASRDVYEAARSQTPISAMFQLGQQQGQLCAAHLKAVVPVMPDFDDSETRLAWRFSNCRAQGVADDELVIAFG